MMDETTRLEIEIARYVDGEMTRTERAAIEQRLADDPELRRIADELTALRPHVAEALGASAGSIDGERIWRRVSERIAARPSPFETFVSGLRVFLQPRVAVAAVAAVLLIGLYILAGNLISPEAAAQPMVTDIEYDNPDIVVVVSEDAETQTAVVWIDGIDTSEVN
jgi:anti-sigma factor RsiW